MRGSRMTDVVVVGLATMLSIGFAGCRQKSSPPVVQQPVASPHVRVPRYVDPMPVEEEDIPAPSHPHRHAAPAPVIHVVPVENTDADEAAQRAQDARLLQQQQAASQHQQEDVNQTVQQSIKQTLQMQQEPRIQSAPGPSQDPNVRIQDAPGPAPAPQGIQDAPGPPPAPQGIQDDPNAPLQQPATPQL